MTRPVDDMYLPGAFLLARAGEGDWRKASRVAPALTLRLSLLLARLHLRLMLHVVACLRKGAQARERNGPAALFADAVGSQGEFRERVLYVGKLNACVVRLASFDIYLFEIYAGIALIARDISIFTDLIGQMQRSAQCAAFSYERATQLSQHFRGQGFAHYLATPSCRDPPRAAEMREMTAR